MPYILRDTTGNIAKISSRPMPNGQSLALDHPEIVTFLKSRRVNPKQIQSYLVDLKNSDTDMARTIEDIVTLLLKKNLVKIADMPQHMQDKMAIRARLRLAIEDIYNQASTTAPDPTI